MVLPKQTTRRFTAGRQDPMDGDVMRLRLKSKTVKKLARKARSNARAAGKPGPPKNPRPGSLASQAEKTAAAKEAFLGAFAQSGCVLHACQACGMGRRTVYNWLKADPDFAERYKDAEDDAIDHLEAVAVKLATGYEKPVFGRLGPGLGDGEIARERVYDGRMVQFLLAKRRPGVYGNKLELTGKDGQPLPVGGAVIILPDNHRDPSPKEGA